MKKNLKAFSLLELAIVMMIIGLLSVGITASNRIIEKARRTRLLMSGSDSPVMAIDDLAVWLDASDKYSIIGGNRASKWLDRSGNGNDVIQPDSAKRPILIENIIMSLTEPHYSSSALYFEDADMHLENLSPQLSGDLTIFTAVIAGTVGAEFQCILNDYTEQDGILFSGLSATGLIFGGMDSAVSGSESIGECEVVIISATVDNNKKLSVYQNGNFIGSTTLIYTPVFNGLVIGDYFMRDGTGNFKGLIAEIIMYGRKLIDSEREEIEEYLMEKYGGGIDGCSGGGGGVTINDYLPV